MTRKPADFKSFLLNGHNKKRLAEIMQDVWCSPEAANRIGDKTVILIVESKAYFISPAGAVSIDCLQSSKEETDTRVILYLK